MQSELGGFGMVCRSYAQEKRLCPQLVIRETQRLSDTFLLVFTPPSQLRMTMTAIDLLIGPCLAAVQISVESRLAFAELWFVKCHLFVPDSIHLKKRKD